MMKQKDIALLIIVVVAAGMFSFFVSRYFISSGAKNLEAQVVEPISTEFQKPDERVFNDKALNPTQLIQIGNTSNSQPF
jgi:hypothetical protein